MPTQKAIVAQSDTLTAERWKAVLEGLDYEVSIAPDGTIAKRQLAPASAVKLFLTDLSLPLEDGFQVIQWLRQQPGGGDIYVAAASAFPTMRRLAIERKDELGIDEILSKSFDDPTLALLLSRSETALATRKKRDQGAKRVAADREAQRLKEIVDLHLPAQGPPEAGLQRIVEDAARIFKVPVALITLVTQDRQWFAAYTGISGRLLDERGTERGAAFCAHVVEADHAETLVVPDARNNPVFSENRLVKDGTVGSYVGSPLVTASGQVLGTLCLIDSKPTLFQQADIALLDQLAGQVAGELELRRQAQAKEQENELLTTRLGARVGLLAAAFNQMGIGILILGEDRQVLMANKAVAALFDLSQDAIIGRGIDDFFTATAKCFSDPAGYLSKMKLRPHGPSMAHDLIHLQLPQSRRVWWMSKPILLPDGRAQLETFIDINAIRSDPGVAAP